MTDTLRHEHALIIPDTSEVTAFQTTARQVAAGRGLRWLSEGVSLCLRAPGRWLLVMLIYLSIYVLLALLPIVGTLLTVLTGPLLLAGLMAFAHGLDTRDDRRLGQMFDGFRRQRGRLFLLGLSYLLLVIATVTATLLVGLAMDGEGLLRTPGPLPDDMIPLLIGLSMLFAALFLPVAMACWFAPMLVFFSGQTLGQALRASLSASLRNWLPLLVYGLALLVAGLALLLLLTLLVVLAKSVGPLALLILPLLVLAGLVGYAVYTASLYQSYKDLFSPEVS